MSMLTNRRRAIATLGVATIGALTLVLPALRADAEVTFTRTSGATRYETAAKLSEQTFAVDVPVAYIATGINFPDALAGAPVAAKNGGPILLTEPGTLPDVTKAELTRLKPKKIVIIGGTTSVTSAVEDVLDDYTDGTITRISGATRYETAANLSAATFQPGVNTVYVALGPNFPDALSGGPAAATVPAGGGPVLLVEQNAIPQATGTELQRLAAQKIIVLGGTGAISDAVITALDPFSTDPVVRNAGADRYATSVAVSKARFTSATKVYLATGENFPDAISGGAPAGVSHTALLLTKKDCIPADVNAEITRLNPTSVIVLGGESAVGSGVMSRIECPGGSSTTSTTASALPTVPALPGLPDLGGILGGLGLGDLLGGLPTLPFLNM